ncbi:MAG: hypothetical protein IJ752_09605 [Alphaproteobacteria bacterium]|nr:hypothetical protein [Alphaproteobacteria bacterium]
MKKIETVKEFVEKLDAKKKVNPKDLSSDQDLTIAIMNLISIEEHLIFSGAKTEKTAFYDLIEEIRETRKQLMQKVIPAYEGEVWCISKHLLASSMRLMEVGTKQQSMGNKKQAYDLFNKAYDLYSLFWGLNMNMINLDDVKWIEDKTEDIKKLSAKVDAVMGASEPAKIEAPAAAEPASANEEEPVGTLAKMKRFVRKAVDCCIE